MRFAVLTTLPALNTGGGVSFKPGLPGTITVGMSELPVKIALIDTPYLTEGSSGLTYVVDRFKGWSHSGHMTLARGERSRLADHASEVL